MKVMMETNVVIMNMNRPTAIMNASNHGSKSGDMVVAPPNIFHQENATLIHRGKSTAIYLTPHENKGIKVIDDIHPTEEQVLRLLAEEQVSRFLPPRCKRRRVLQVKSFQGNPALHFEWAPGNSLKLWLQSEENKEAGLRDRLRIATSITKTLYEFHEGNVCVQNLDLENIILDISRSVVHHCVDASLINLSSAVIILDIPEDEVKILQKKDLQDLGYILNIVFRGELNSDSSEKTRRESMEGGEDADTDEKYEDLSSTRGKRGKAISPGEGLPVYLTSLISTLIQPSTEFYKDVKSVLHDLEIANRKFDIYLNPSINRDPQGVRHFKIPDDAFYGRESEWTMLLQSFNSTIMVNGQTTLTCVSGHSGMGKTSLINQIKSPLKSAKGYMIRGKFDLSARPDAVLHLALNSFFGEIMNEACDVQDEIISRIQETFGSKVSMLTDSIPNLAKLLGVEEGLESNAGARCHQQWKFLLCTLIAAISTQKHPIVCFFDDLQWADEASLDTIQMLALDCDVRYCHYLLSFRDDEDEPTRRATSIIDKIEQQGVPVTKIKLGPIPVDTVNAMCSENLYLPPSLCRSLSTAVHNKTGGIMLFVVNFLKSLSNDGLLRFNASLGRFEYNIQLVQMKAINDFEGVSNYLSQQMIQLPSKVLLCLKVAACFGFVIDVDNLTSTLNGLDIDLEILDQLISYGYLQRPCSGQFQFSHDQVHQAAYSLIDSTKKKSFHLLIGSRLLMRNTKPEDLEGAIFDIVRHMSEGASLLHSHPSPKQRNEVARLNVVAGEKAIKSSSFSSAAKYFEAALSLHGEDGDYDFLMKVYGLLQLPLFAIGDFTRLETIIDKTLSLSRSFEEKRQTYLCLVRVLSAKGQLQETITMGLTVLEQLGEPIPDQPTMNLVFQEKMDVESILSDYSDDKILSLPQMADDKKMFAMDFLSKLLYVSFFAKPLCLPIIVFRMVKLSLNYGLCDLSAIAFSIYGALLVNQSAPDFEEGARNGRIAISIMKKFDSKAVLARVYTNVYGTINLWREPLQASLDKHLEAYDEGALAGDMEYAITSLLQYAALALCGCGTNLETLEIRTRKYLRKAIQYKQSTVAKCLVVTHSHILELIGGSEDSFATYFQCTEDEFFQEAQDNNEGILCRLVPGKRLFLSLFFGDIVAAEKWFKIRQTFKMNTSVSPRFIGALTAEFHAAIIALHLARKKGRADQDELIATAEESIGLFREGASSSNWNFSHKLSLLEAEKAFTNGDEEKATDCYKAAIKAAKAHRFVHEEGLSNERAARFYHHYGKVDEALLHLNQAKDCYEKWGALALSRQMEQEIELLHESTS